MFCLDLMRSCSPQKMVIFCEHCMLETAVMLLKRESKVFHKILAYTLPNVISSKNFIVGSLQVEDFRLYVANLKN